MLNFQILFGQLKKHSEVCSDKNQEKNEIKYLQYVSHDVEISAEDAYGIILNLKYIHQTSAQSQRFFFTLK